MIGPHRASRTVGAVGIPTQPGVFFMGVNNGGLWKTDDYGRTWRPILDRAPTGSVGDLAVSPSHPDTIYVGTGEGLHRPDLGVGDGIFKSTDGGTTWQHVGLPDVQQVGRIVVHPTNPDIVFVAGMDHPYGPNEERGVFRTRDGGRTWEKVLSVDANTGANQVELDANDPTTVYAALWEHREGPWENASFTGTNSGLLKSVDDRCISKMSGQQRVISASIGVQNIRLLNDQSTANIAIDQAVTEIDTSLQETRQRMQHLAQELGIDSVDNPE